MWLFLSYTKLFTYAEKRSHNHISFFFIPFFFFLNQMAAIVSLEKFTRCFLVLIYTLETKCLMWYVHEKEKYFQKHTRVLVHSRVWRVERHPLATSRSHIMSGRKPEAQCHLIGKESRGVWHGCTAGEVFWLRAQRYWVAERQSVWGARIKDKVKVSKSLWSVWCLGFGTGLGRQREWLIQLDELCVHGLKSQPVKEDKDLISVQR